MIKKLLIACFLLPCFCIKAQNDSAAVRSFPIKKIEIGLLAMSQVGLSVFWYNNFDKFKVRNDYHQWLQMDKVGHLMSSYQVMRSNKAICMLGGMQKKQAQTWSLIAIGTFYTGIEIMDGFSQDYGFSFTDFAANGIGIGLAILPENIQNQFSLRFSYHKSSLSQFRPETLGKSNIEQVFKDYNGQTYWLSFWQKPRDKWYNFIGISFGYGANGLLGGSNNPEKNKAGETLPQLHRSRQYYLALDFNVEGLAPNKPKLQKWLRLLDFIKIPMPTLMFEQGQNPQFFPAYF